MANNITILDADSAEVVIKTTDNAGVHTGHVNVDSSALPTGAATSAKQDTVIGHVDGIEALLGTIDADTSTLAGAVSGTEVQVDVISSALPTGAASAANQTTEIAHLAAIEAAVESTDPVTVNHSTTGIGHGVKTVTTAGTDVVLASSTAAKWVVIQAQTDNTGNIAVGATGVDATEATGTGIILEAGDTITLPVDNLADVFIDASVSGEGVRFTYGT